MTDRTDAFATDDAPDELDRHARAAASALLARVAEMVDDEAEVDRSAGAGPATGATAPITAPPTASPVAAGPVAARPVAAPTDRSGGEADADTADPHVVPLGRATDRPGARSRRRRLLACAAAATVVAIGAAIALTGDSGAPDVTSGGPGGALLPAWLPDGLEPLMAVDLDRADRPDAVDGEVAIYGDRDAPDPWAETLTVTHLLVPDEMASGMQPQEGEAVTVSGHEATLSEMDGIESGTGGPGWRVQWSTEDGLVGVAGTNLTRDEVLTAAALVTDGPGIAEDGLPRGFTELARGPFDAAAPSLSPSVFASGLAVSYGAPDGADDEQAMLAIHQRPGPASAVDLVRATSADSEAITVRGDHGVLSRHGRGGLVVQWAEPEGRLVTVVASGVSERSVLRIVEGMRPADAEEIEALLSEPATPSPGEFVPVPSEQVEVTAGEVPGGGRWRVVVDTAAPASLDALSVEQVSADGSFSSGAASGGLGGSARPLDLSSDSTDGGTVVYGTVTADAATVTLEAPGRPAVPLELHGVDGWDLRVVASLVADIGPESVAVARAVDGREVARTTIYVAPDPITPGSSDPATGGGDDTAVEETCVTEPDGSVTCSTAAEATGGMPARSQAAPTTPS
jgi:hypothetical protein